MQVRNQLADLRYILKEDRDESEFGPTVHTMRQLTLQERIDQVSAHEMTSRDGTSVTLKDVLRKEVRLVKKALTGIENLRGSDGEIIPYKTQDGEVSDEVLRWYTDRQIKELADAAWVHSNPSPELAKKFELEFTLSTADSQQSATSVDSPEAKD